MYSLKKNFERAKVMIIAELTKFFLHFSQIFFPTGNFSRNCSDFQRIFSQNIHISATKHGGNILHTQQLFLCHLCYSTNKIPQTMKKKILPIIISIFWLAFFSYLTYIKMYAVVILSLILLSMTMAMSVSNETES